MRTALTIAGSDSSGAAGIQADLKTFAALGVYGASAITAVTAQNTTGVLCAEPLEADLVAAQIEAVATDMGLHATKTGMLANAAIVEAVAATIRELDLPNVVVDPVMRSTSGARLLDPDGLQMLRSELLPRARVTTPNVAEAEALSGRGIESLEHAREAARRIHDFGPSAVIVTGGHLPTVDVVDLLFDGRTFTEFRTARHDASAVHGTGCTFAAAVAAHLARGDTLADAARQAQQYVGGAIVHAPRIGRGRGPLHHFWGGILDG